MITKTDLNWWLGLEPELDWQFATTYADGAPHEYVAEGHALGLTHDDFVRAAHVIRTFGEPMKFYKQTRIYLTTSTGWKYWTMNADLSQTCLVNRGRAEHAYGVQNAPRTASGLESTYDALASEWDQKYGMTNEEKDATTGLIRDQFGDKLWRTLDVGCGTGWILDAGLVEPIRYVGVDPSTAMLNVLVSKHPHLAGLHPTTWAGATQERVLCGTQYDTVLCLGGAASHLTPQDIVQLQLRAKRGAIVMHWAPEQDPTIGKRLDLGELSRSATCDIAMKLEPIGRFIAAVVPSV
ncbi:class I SAM-dependent methyltransferase [Rathayibacter soli]|uniref:class I SAM-dependent methyltransferase n=1 Tax=Rathayibacter soli TaxID=3144168 RepID=UPI0027E4B44C|nr:class I SAM-dependent methyltransferase [Glaciibacter superstes]